MIKFVIYDTATGRVKSSGVSNAPQGPVGLGEGMIVGQLAYQGQMVDLATQTVRDMTDAEKLAFKVFVRN